MGMERKILGVGGGGWGQAEKNLLCGGGGGIVILCNHTLKVKLTKMYIYNYMYK